MGADKYDYVIAFGYSCFVQLFLKDETHHDFVWTSAVTFF